MYLAGATEGKSGWHSAKITTNMFGANLACLARSRFSIAPDRSEPDSAPPWKPHEELDAQTLLGLHQKAGAEHLSLAEAKRKLHLLSYCPSFPVCCEAKSKSSGQIKARTLQTHIPQ